MTNNDQFKDEHEKNFYYAQCYEVQVLEQREKSLKAKVFFKNAGVDMWLPFTDKTRHNFQSKGGKKFIAKNYVNWVIEKEKEERRKKGEKNG